MRKEEIWECVFFSERALLAFGSRHSLLVARLEESEGGYLHWKCGILIKAFNTPFALTSILSTGISMLV